MRFQVTVEVDLDVSAPLTVQELARLEDGYGLQFVKDLHDSDVEITPLMSQAVIWSKLQTLFPTIKVDQFDSIEGLTDG